MRGHPSVVACECVCSVAQQRQLQGYPPWLLVPTLRGLQGGHLSCSRPVRALSLSTIKGTRFRQRWSVHGCHSDMLSAAIRTFAPLRPVGGCCTAGGVLSSGAAYKRQEEEEPPLRLCAQTGRMRRADPDRTRGSRVYLELTDTSHNKHPKSQPEHRWSSNYTPCSANSFCPIHTLINSSTSLSPETAVQCLLWSFVFYVQRCRVLHKPRTNSCD